MQKKKNFKEKRTFKMSSQRLPKTTMWLTIEFVYNTRNTKRNWNNRLSTKECQIEKAKCHKTKYSINITNSQ